MITRQGTQIVPALRAAVEVANVPRVYQLLRVASADEIQAAIPDRRDSPSTNRQTEKHLIIRALLRSCSDIRPLLSESIERERVDEVLRLIKHASEADVAVTNVPGKLCLWSLAVVHGNRKIMALLLGKSGNAHATLMLAAQAKDRYDVQKLVQNRARQGNFGTQLGFKNNMWTAKYFSEEAAFEELVRADWDLSLALCRAMEGLRTATVRILLEFAFGHDLVKAWPHACTCGDDRAFDAIITAILPEVDGSPPRDLPPRDEIL
ncbi:hypothetical protein LTS18_012830, partial [Coniosporium uncinatum]